MKKASPFPFLSGTPTAAADEDNTVQVDRLSSRVLVLRVAADPGSNITAIKSDQGIVVFDTTLSPFGASLIRQRSLK